MVGCLTNIYYLTVGHLTEKFLKKSNALHMPAPAPPPLWGLTLKEPPFLKLYLN